MMPNMHRHIYARLCFEYQKFDFWTYFLPSLFPWWKSNQKIKAFLKFC